MAKQNGSLPIRGTLDNITYYKRKGRYFARAKSNLDAERVMTEPAFQRTRENASEFTEAAHGGKLIRDSIRPMLRYATDNEACLRLFQLLMNVLHLDPISDRGLRKVSKGPTSLLEGYEFNREAILTQRLAVPLTVKIDRIIGTISLDVPSFIPDNVVKAPAGATHFKILSAGVELDFDTCGYVSDLKKSAPLLLDSTRNAPLTIIHAVPAGSTKPLMLVTGLQFMQDINGKLYPLRNGAYNALRILKCEA